MNSKGLKLNKLLAKRIYEKFDSISNSTFRGMDVFNSFSWKSFSREEFKNILSLFNALLDDGFFLTIDDNHPFIFNYSNEITEMDIATVLSFEGKQVFLDFETKNDEDFDLVRTKVNIQVENRIKNYMPQLLKNNSYVIAGFANNVFIRGCYFDGKEKHDLLNKDNLFKLLSHFKQSSGCEDFLAQLSSMASIAKVCRDIQEGNYKYYEDTNRVYSSISSKIEFQNACLVYGNAGTGKSILALKLFFERSDTKILLLNSKLYFALGLDSYYGSSRATFKTEFFLNNIDENTVSIVDECQRMPIEKIVEIIKKSKFTFLFGDNKQAFMAKSTLADCKKLTRQLIDDYGLNVSYKIIKRPRRYSDEVDKALSMLTAINPNINDCKLPQDYNISLFYDEKSFLQSYEKTDGVKKMYSPLYGSDYRIDIGGTIFEKALYNNDSFSLSNYDKYCYGTTYHALSFDVDHCFVILKHTILIQKDKKRVLYRGRNAEEATYDEIQLYLNELNVLFTRGRKSLNICVNNIETYLYFNSIINKLR